MHNYLIVVKHISEIASLCHGLHFYYNNTKLIFIHIL